MTAKELDDQIQTILDRLDASTRDMKRLKRRARWHSVRLWFLTGSWK